ncbi:hypothetical protein [uncultured Microscilla sp.]|uniref:hypothetical protein n=1 Tax=uncultured Microscilla sp. TaxID=432653 RepID=UPI002605C1C8|nr:hypothetical protein [uncultured Microscilla sp.]
MNNKKNKLTIKSNWDKNLTISDKEMDVLRGGVNVSYSPDCICPPQGKVTDGKPPPEAQ